jgi:hypothetical protein
VIFMVLVRYHQDVAFALCAKIRVKVAFSLARF